MHGPPLLLPPHGNSSTPSPLLFSATHPPAPMRPTSTATNLIDCQPSLPDNCHWSHSGHLCGANPKPGRGAPQVQRPAAGITTQLLRGFLGGVCRSRPPGRTLDHDPIDEDQATISQNYPLSDTERFVLNRGLTFDRLFPHLN